MNFLDDPTIQQQLYPFTLTRSAADIRIGILTIREKWLLARGTGYYKEVPANLLPTASVLGLLDAGRSLNDCEDCLVLNYPWEIFQLNDKALRLDYELLSHNRSSAAIPSTVQVINPEQVFIEEGAILQYCTLNASMGPIYIGRGAEIMEGATIRGPFALCEGAVVKMGARIYGATTIGPYSVVGGEVKNSVFFGYSNKAHDGYLGDSVIGTWCNLGGGTTNSNLKNNVSHVNVFNPEFNTWVSAGIKCGLLMGDHCRTAINTTINTGTVTGVSCNIFGDGTMPKYLPSFSWGKQAESYLFDKALHDIVKWMALKKHTPSEKEVLKLKYIYDHNKSE